MRTSASCSRRTNDSPLNPYTPIVAKLRTGNTHLLLLLALLLLLLPVEPE